MNRIKSMDFRAWDSLFKEMKPLTGFNFPNNDNIDLYGVFGQSKRMMREDVVIMQSIGQKDIHNKEIFEGDICQFGDSDEHTFGIIKWDEASCGFKYFYDETTYFHLDDEPYKEMEIIGNIWEISDTELQRMDLKWGK